MVEIDLILKVFTFHNNIFFYKHHNNVKDIFCVIG